MNKSNGLVLAICRSEKKSQPKKDEGEDMLKENFGLLGDAHAGTEKEISLLSQEAVEAYCQTHNLSAPPGSFAENLRIGGINLLGLPLRTILQIGETELQIIAKGKDPSAAHTYSYQGHSLLPTMGVFTKVVEGGTIKKGMSCYIQQQR